MGLAAWRYLLISALVIGADQWTKAIALANVALGERIPVFPGFSWTLAYNTGVAFSLFADGAEWQKYGLAGFAVLVSGAFAWMMTTLSPRERLSAVAYALIIGGALGNVIDRLRIGKVVDFILVYYREHDWPAFNVADSCIVVGAALMLLFGWRQTGTEPAAPDKKGH